MSCTDLAVSFPARGVIRLSWLYRNGVEVKAMIDQHALTGESTPAEKGVGFGIMASVVTNNVAALAALGNGVLPLRKVAQIEAERRHRLEMTQAHAMERNPVPATAASADRRTDADRDRQRVLAASA